MWIKSRVSLGSIFSVCLLNSTLSLSLLSSFMRPVLLLLLYYFIYIWWYYENLMIHWAHPSAGERERLSMLRPIEIVSNNSCISESFEWMYEEKLFMKSFQWLNWIHFRKNDPGRETKKRYVWSKTSWFHFLYYSLFLWRNWSLLKGWECYLLLVCTLILIWLHLEDELL